MHWRQHSLEATVTEPTATLASVNTQLSIPKSEKDQTVFWLMQNTLDCNQLQKRDCNQLQKLTSLHTSVVRYVAASLAENTRRAYSGDLADFIDFGGKVPCTPEELASYIAERAKVHSPFTIGRRIVGISRAHTSQGYPDPAKNDLVRAVLRGVRRSHGKPQRQVAPLLKPDLLTFISVMQGAKGVRDRALILLGFAAALRRSELVDLKVEHISFVKEGAVLHIQRSKTDQIGEGRKIAVPYGRSSICPVKAVERWISFANIAKGPLFRSIKKGGKICEEGLTSQSVALILKSYATSVGLDAKSISGHSLRSGLATSAAMTGVPIWKIKAQTGHKSDAMIGRYIRDGNLFDNNAASAVL